MDERQLIEIITKNVYAAIKEQLGSNEIDGLNEVIRNTVNSMASDEPKESKTLNVSHSSSQNMFDLNGQEFKDTIVMSDVENPLALKAFRRSTTARVGIGRAGNRLSTKALISLRADHALAQDAVVKPVDENVLKELNLDTVQSCARDINEHLTRPDLGRKLSPEAIDWIKANCVKNPQVQIYVSDGLSNSAIESNVRELLPILQDGLAANGVTMGTPFFVKFGRVPTSDHVSEITGAECTCVLLGERPGLVASDSMSAYITYKGYVGIEESKRKVVSNIHKHGIQPVEAGAYLVDAILEILKNKKSGV